MSKYSFDELTGGFKELVDIIGLEAAMALSKEMGGLEIYIPKLDSITRMLRNENIVSEFNGSNYSQLALKHKLTERQIRSILDKARNQIKSTTVFDFLNEISE